HIIRRRLTAFGVVVVPRLLLVVLAFFCLALCPASAQIPSVLVPKAEAPSKPAPATTSPATSALTPDEARRALETLQDDKKRAEIINTLRAIANAPQPKGATPAPAPQTPATEPVQVVPLEADSLGAQLLLQVSEQFATISNEIAAAANAVTRFPLLWYWLKR